MLILSHTSFSILIRALHLYHAATLYPFMLCRILHPAAQCCRMLMAQTQSAARDSQTINVSDCSIDAKDAKSTSCEVHIAGLHRHPSPPAPSQGIQWTRNFGVQIPDPAQNTNCIKCVAHTGRCWGIQQHALHRQDGLMRCRGGPTSRRAGFTESGISRS